MNMNGEVYNNELESDIKAVSQYYLRQDGFRTKHNPAVLETNESKALNILLNSGGEPKYYHIDSSGISQYLGSGYDFIDTNLLGNPIHTLKSQFRQHSRDGKRIFLSLDSNIFYDTDSDYFDSIVIHVPRIKYKLNPSRWLFSEGIYHNIVGNELVQKGHLCFDEPYKPSFINKCPDLTVVRLKGFTRGLWLLDLQLHPECFDPIRIIDALREVYAVEIKNRKEPITTGEKKLRKVYMKGIHGGILAIPFLGEEEIYERRLLQCFDVMSLQANGIVQHYQRECGPIDRIVDYSSVIDDIKKMVIKSKDAYRVAQHFSYTGFQTFDELQRLCLTKFNDILYLRRNV
jgi:hypothetical protein